jgi:AsmA-like C-terminal region
LGKTGLATKLLTWLRTTEIIRLRMPSLKDQGLVYDTCAGKISMQKGFLTMEEYVLRSPTLALAAAGTVDFPRDTMNLAVDAHLLGLVTGLLEIVPGLQRPAEEVRQYTSFPLAITGSPKDPKISFVRREGEDTARGRLREVAPSKEDMIGGILRDSARDALRRILGDK